MNEDYVVITNGFNGEEWAVIRDESRLTLYRPTNWSAPYESLGLSYHPGAGIDLPSNPRRALRKARRHVQRIAKEQRRRAERAERTKSYLRGEQHGE